MTDLSTVADWLEETYGNNLSVYHYNENSEDSHFIRLTNGSAGFAFNMRIRDGKIQIRGQRYGEEFTDDVPIEKEALPESLSRMI